MLCSATMAEDSSIKSADKEQGVAAVERAFTIMNAFTVRDVSLSLHELAERTGLYKSTILRLISSLERWGCMHRLQDGRYQLGPRLMNWSRIYQSSLRLDQHVLPVLKLLVSETGEGASYFKREGDMRVCLYRVNSERAIQEYVTQGDMLPLGRGAAGRIMLDYANVEQTGMPARSPVYVSFGETDPEVTALAAPVFESMNALAGSIAVSGPRSRMTRTVIDYIAECLLRAATDLTQRLGGDPALFRNASLPFGPGDSTAA